jgi:hypothetical protein
VRANTSAGPGNFHIRPNGVFYDSVHDLEGKADLEYLDRVELEFRVQAALDVSGFTKAVLLTRKQKVPNWFALAPQCFNQSFGLIGWYDGVLSALKEDHRSR